MARALSGPGVTLATAQLDATYPEAGLSPLMFDGHDPESGFFRPVCERIGKAMKMDPPCASGSRRTEAGEFGDEFDGGFDVEDELPTQARRLSFVEVDGSEELLGCRSEEFGAHLCPQTGPSFREDFFSRTGFEVAVFQLGDAPYDLLIPGLRHFRVSVEAGNQALSEPGALLRRKEKSSGLQSMQGRGHDCLRTGCSSGA